MPFWQYIALLILGCFSSGVFGLFAFLFRAEGRVAVLALVICLASSVLTARLVYRYWDERGGITVCEIGAVKSLDSSRWYFALVGRVPIAFKASPRAVFDLQGHEVEGGISDESYRRLRPRDRVQVCYRVGDLSHEPRSIVEITLLP